MVELFHGNFILFYTAPWEWSDWGSKPSKHPDGLKYDRRHDTGVMNTQKWLLHGLKCKLGLKCGENIQNLADAPSFCHTTSPQVGPGESSKPSKHYYGFRYDLRYIIQYSTDKENVFKSFKLQIGAKIDNFLHFLMLRLR